MVKKELINRFDLTALQDSFTESAMAAGCAKEFWRKPTYVEYIRNKNPFDGMTIFTDKQLHRVTEIESTYKVAILQEPRELLPQIYQIIVQYEDYYDLILTFDNELLQRSEKYVFSPGDSVTIKTEGCKIHEKSKLVSFPFSLKTELFGHRLRHILAKDLIPNLDIPYKVDYYGAAVGNHVEDKSDTLKDYMFQIAIENVKREFYFTDKILDCVITGTIPIYWGPKNISNYFNPKGILQFNHPDEIKNILKNLTEEQYYDMLPYVEENYEAAKYYMIQDDFFYKIIKKDYKKMVKIINYNKDRYRFTQEVEKIFDVWDLAKLHKIRSDMFPNYKLGFHNEVKTDYHKKFYSVLNDDSKNEELKKSYDLFINEVVAEHIGGSFCYQAFPSFRVHLPGKKAVNKWHYDSDEDHMHPEWEINFQLALTDSTDTQAMWIESVPGLGDFHPVNLKKDQFAIFYGNKCRHGNKSNETDLTRVSMDFRVMPIDRYNPEKNKSSAQKGTKFVIGGYYKLFER